MKKVKLLAVIFVSLIVGWIGSTLYWNSKFRHTYEGMLTGMELEVGLDKVIEVQLALNVINAEGVENKDKVASLNVINAYLGYQQNEKCSRNNFLCEIHSEFDRGSVQVDDDAKMLSFRNKLVKDMRACKLTVDICKDN